MTHPPQAGLPDGFVVRLNRHTRVVDNGKVLVGGSPTRVARLTHRARAMLRGGELRVTNGPSRALAEHLLASGLGDPVVGELPEADETQVTYVVPVHNRPGQLDRLLSSIGPGRRVIVVDDASSDRETMSRVAARHLAEFVPLDRNVGPAGARNVGLALVETPFVAFVDSDVVLEPGATATLLRHFADPRVAVVAPRVLGLGGADVSAAANNVNPRWSSATRGTSAAYRDRRQPGDSAGIGLDTPGLRFAPVGHSTTSGAQADSTSANWITRYENARSSLDHGEDPAIVQPRSRLTWVSSTTLVARVDAIGDGFDDRLRAGEDVDLVWRLVESGWRVRFEPVATVRHEHRTTLRSWLGRKAFYGTGAQPLADRHPDNIAPVVLPPWGAAVLVALGAQRSWSVPVAAAVSAGVCIRLARTVGTVRHPYGVAAWLTASGLAMTVSQGFALLLRHWWPVTAIGCLFSRRLRRAVLVAALVDTAWEYARTRPNLDPVRFAVARRLDDAAYGAGVWWSAIRAGSMRALRPDVRWRRRSDAITPDAARTPAP